MLNLQNVPPGKHCVVERMQGPDVILERLKEFGVVPEQALQVLRRLPFGGPTIVQIGATLVALRENEAECVILRGN